MHRRTILSIFPVIIVALIAGCFFFWPTAYRTLDSWKLIPHDEALTELYISDYNSLPVLVAPHQVVPFTFVIHNLEGATTTYRYNVYAETASSTPALIGFGMVSTRPGEYKSLHESFTVGSTTASTTIYIELPEKAVNLHFMIPLR